MRFTDRNKFKNIPYVAKFYIYHFAENIKLLGKEHALLPWHPFNKMEKSVPLMNTTRCLPNGTSEKGLQIRPVPPWLMLNEREH